MSNAPFGYRWIGRDRCSLAEVCRRLQNAGEATATGKRIWSRQAVWHILQNPAYQGRAAYGKTHVMPRGKRARPRAARGRPAEPRRSNAPVAADPGTAFSCRFLRWSMPHCFERHRNSCRRTGAGLAWVGEGLDTCYRGSLAAQDVVTPTTARPRIKWALAIK
jgi:hypothetical protein